MGHIKEALANFREARELFVLAEPQVTEWHGESALADMKQISNNYLVEIASILNSTNSFFEAEKCFLELLSTPELSAKPRLTCLKGLASIHNQRKDWVRARQYCERGSARSVGAVECAVI